MTAQKPAKWISWLSCSWILLLNLREISRYGFHIGAFILFAVVAVQIWLMLSKRYIAAFRLASVEVAITAFALFSSLYPPPDAAFVPLLPFKLAFWVWLFGGSTLTTAAWVCHKAAKAIKYGSPTQDNTLNAEIKEYFHPWKAEIKEYLRPWKLTTFAAGLTVLIGGSLYYEIPGWDMGSSLIIGTLTYITAPWLIYMVKSRQWRKSLTALFACCFTIYLSYAWYNAYLDHPVAVEINEAYFFPSFLLYLLCGLLWSHRMSLRELLSELADTVYLHVPRKPLNTRQ
ncbi:MAG: hypothetical protein HY796_07225 [Elusimicrobia bacterium]|nr:hypothetical protein [Elusimicrobiota bacterium]